MWFGTHSGLNRFDGYNFTEYKSKPHDRKSLSFNVVRTLCEDRKGNLWVGTDGGGLHRFNREEKDFTRFPYHNTADPQPPNGVDYIQSIRQDDHGFLWIGTFGGGLLRFDPEKETWTRFSHLPGAPGTISHNHIYCLCMDRFGKFWIGTNGGGLNHFDPVSKKFSHYRPGAGNPNSLADDIVTDVLEDSNGIIWVATRNGLNCFDRNTKRFTPYRHDPKDPDSLSGNLITSLFEDSNGLLWIGTMNNGLNLLKDEKNNKRVFTRYHHQPYNPYSLSQNYILSLAEDRSGSLWIGTNSGGINRIDRIKQHFIHVYNDPDNPNSLSSNDVVSIYEDKEKVLWVGTGDSGLNRYNPVNGRFTAFTRNSQTGLTSNDVSAILEDSTGTMWVGTWGGGLNRLVRPKDKNSTDNWEKKVRFISYRQKPGIPKGPSCDFIICLSEDKQHHLWIGTRKGGLNRFDHETNKFTPFPHNPHDINSLSSNAITTIFPDINNPDILWVGTYSMGLNRFDQTTGAATRYTHNVAVKNTLSHNSIQSIYISPSMPEIIWIGTYGGGLNRFDTRTETWDAYNESDGLSDDSIYGILEDNQKRFWISTNNGISRFEPQSAEFKNYYAWDGLQSNQFNQGAYFKDSEGRFYFGGVNGFNIFQPDKIKGNPNPPPVVPTLFKKYNKEGIYEELFPQFDEITLSYSDYAFYFEFAALNYIAPTKNKYKYKIINATDDWIPINNKRDITLTNLPPGYYTLRVIGSNNDNVWNEDGVTIKIFIKPPFWQTWWFRILLGVALMLMIFLFYRIRVRQLMVQRRRLETQVAIRTREIREQKDIIEEQNHDLEYSNRELKKTEKSLRETNATKDKFFSIISHDLRNPLTALLGTSTLLFDMFEMFTEEKRKKHLKSIIRSANHLFDLLENLLQWARTQTKGLKPKPAVIDIKKTMDDNISLCVINARKKKIDLSGHSPDNLYVYADRNMFNTVLRNLITNAIKFTDSEGKIFVSAEAKDNVVEISVRDTGVGISEEDAPLLFQIGTHYSTQGTAKEKGTGLGLILCREFVESNGGTIWYETPKNEKNEKIKGSVFKFTVPVPKDAQ